MNRQADHLARVRKVLETFADDLDPAVAMVVLEDADVAIVGGLSMGLTMEQIKQCAIQVLDELVDPPGHKQHPDRN